MSDHEINLNISAEDDASRVLDDVADKVDALDDGDATVEVDADVRDAMSAIERFERDVDGLTDDARELRVEFRAQQLQRDIRNALRDLERLEDPVDIAARTADLENAQKDLRDLAELADRKYEIEIDADPKRTAQRAAGDLESMRARGEGLQSAIPALRGFTDELGGTAAAGGIAGQAVADLGDFSLIMGEKFGISERQTAALGTALGAAGLAGVAIPVALAGLQALVDLLQNTDTATAEARERLGEYLDVAEGFDRFLDRSPDDTLLQALVGDDEDKIAIVTRALAELELNISDLPGVLRQANAGGREWLVTQLELAGVTRETAEAIADAGGDLAALPGPDASGLSNTIAAFVDLRDLADGVDLEAVFEDGARQLAVFDEEAETFISLAEDGRITWEQALAEIGRRADLADDELTAMGQSGRDAGDDIAAGAGTAEGALDRLRGKMDVDRLARTMRQKMTEAFLAVVSGAEDAEEKTDAAKLAVLDYADSFDNIPRNLETKIATLIDRGSLQQAVNILNSLERTRVVRYNLSVGVVDTRLPAEVRSGGGITAGTGGNTYNVYVPASDGRALTTELDRWGRVNGP